MQVPLLRGFGLALLFLLVLAHNQLVFARLNWPALSTLALFFAAYALASWLLLRVYYERAPFDLGLLFLNLDYVP